MRERSTIGNRVMAVWGVLIFLVVIGIIVAGSYTPGPKPQTNSSAGDQTSSALFYILKNNHWGFIDHNGKIIIPPTFDSPDDLTVVMPKLGFEASAFEVHDSVVEIPESTLSNPKYADALSELASYPVIGLHDDLVRNKTVVNRRLISVGPFEDGLAPVYKNDHWGYINTEGKTIIPFVYDQALPFSDGWGAVYKNKKGWTFTDPRGGLLNPGNYYEDADSFSEGMARVKTNSLWGFINTKGDWVIKPVLPFAGNYSEGAALYKTDNDSTGLMDKRGYVFEKAKYTRMGSLTQGLAPFQTERGWWGYVNVYGTPIIQPQFEDAGPFSEGLAGVRVGKYYGFINRYGTMVIKPRFIFLFPFKEGLAPVQVDDKWGYVDKTGTLVIPARFDWAYQFRNGLAPVEVNNKLGYIDTEGHYIWQPTN